jgi:hypothetical protein
MINDRVVTNGDIRRAGFYLALGATYYLSLIGIAALALLWIADAVGIGHAYDDTDSKALNERSGVLLRTDYGTGCQYLEGGRGGLTPRLGADGKQVCR